MKLIEFFRTQNEILASYNEFKEKEKELVYNSLNKIYPFLPLISTVVEYKGKKLAYDGILLFTHKYYNYYLLENKSIVAIKDNRIRPLESEMIENITIEDIVKLRGYEVVQSIYNEIVNIINELQKNIISLKNDTNEQKNITTPNRYEQNNNSFEDRQVNKYNYNNDNRNNNKENKNLTDNRNKRENRNQRPDNNGNKDKKTYPTSENRLEPTPTANVDLQNNRQEDKPNNIIKKNDSQPNNVTKIQEKTPAIEIKDNNTSQKIDISNTSSSEIINLDDNKEDKSVITPLKEDVVKEEKMENESDKGNSKSDNLEGIIIDLDELNSIDKNKKSTQNDLPSNIRAKKSDDFTLDVTAFELDLDLDKGSVQDKILEDIENLDKKESKQKDLFEESAITVDLTNVEEIETVEILDSSNPISDKEQKNNFEEEKENGWQEDEVVYASYEEEEESEDSQLYEAINEGYDVSNYDISEDDDFDPYEDEDEDFKV